MSIATSSIVAGLRINEREVPLVSTSALFSLPLGHAFLNGMGKTHLLVQGRLPQPPRSILEEFDIIRYSDERGEEKPLIVERRKAELAATRAAMQRFMPRTRGSEDEGVDPGIRMAGGVDTRAGQSRTHVSGDEFDHAHANVRWVVPKAPAAHYPTAGGQGSVLYDDISEEPDDESRPLSALAAERQRGAVDDDAPPLATPRADEDEERGRTPPNRYDDELTIS